MLPLPTMERSRFFGILRFHPGLVAGALETISHRSIVVETLPNDKDFPAIIVTACFAYFKAIATAMMPFYFSP